MTRFQALKMPAILTALLVGSLLTACAGMNHMKKSNIPTDQNPAHDMHKTPGT